MVLSASPPDQFRVIASHLDQIAADLTQDYNLLRIKKLLFCVCTGTWETDRQQLERLALRGLLQHLLELAPSFEVLQQRINQVVATLNKSAEYTIVANSVISRLLPLYAELQHRQTASQSLYCTVAQQLEQASELRRIKKLLLLTCRSTWENNAVKLEQLSLLELVQELHQIAPSPESLRLTLHQVARALSKPEEYGRVANLISAAFQPLYQASDSPTSLELPEEEPDTEVRQSTAETTEFTQTQPSLNPKLTTLPSSRQPEPHSGSGGVVSTGRASLKVVSSSAPQSGPRSKPNLKVLPLAQPYTTEELFDLRLNLMQDANPLKAKIVLFSLLHEPFQENAEHETMLKTHELDELLRILFLSYRQYPDLEANLRLAVKRLANEDYVQAGEAILKVVQPFYALPSLSSGSLQAVETTGMKAATHELTLPESD
ncbi:MAG: hypothetical protein ACKO7W_05105 [Elainella sp.]